ncbi:MAG: protein kinase [Planctomycetales bacterium]|nr:protein kinase [Planctomycetales bacterium]
MLLEPTKVSESILGYNLKERIGAGGYGEVWVAEAPGGLLKAVKLIYGFHDENRAQRELKALNRIKEVRHAFLLSLERIEVVEGRLVVVTELAEKSLKDRFCECIDSGLPGIPRDELLTYICDAAEALDFLSEVHSLPHLDVKPENLLVVGGHIKVADFGLVKDIHDGTQSLMAGLTPTYAPPELFDGHPSRFSDQYSLAIVFQEMLTGTRPFPGKTAAQLASQHLHGTPALGKLPFADQKIVRRALTKSPDARFPDCRAFAEELKHKRVRRKIAKSHDDSQTATDVTDRAETPGGTLSVAPSKLATLASKMMEKKLPPAQVNAEDLGFRPTLFIGIGETATGILRQLKHRFRERLGENSETPSLRILCIDTDVRDTTKAMTGSELSTLQYDEVLAIPLRTSAEYRARADLNLNWLSRRWIYNVPKSGQTECLRPLGRLAFVDHHRAVFDRLNTVIDQMTDDSNIAKSAATTEMPVSKRGPRVVVVSSISGGTGSGMVADVAYAARTALGEAGFPDAEVLGMLLYSLGRSSTRRDITAANAFSCLSELYHYSHVAGFPGDPSCDLPEFSDLPTFDQTYLIDLGSDPLPDEYLATADILAEYLFLDSASRCGAYFSACRRADEGTESKYNVRSVGLSHSGWVGGDLVSLPASVLGNGLLSFWADGPLAPDSHENMAALVETTIAESQIEIAALIDRIETEVELRVGKDVNAAMTVGFEGLAMEAAEIFSQGGSERLMERLHHTIDNVMGRQASNYNRFEARVDSVMEVISVEVAQEYGMRLVESILSTLDLPGARLVQAREVFTGFQQHLQGLNQQVTDLLETCQADIEQLQGMIRCGCRPQTQKALNETESAQADDRLRKALERLGVAKYSQIQLSSCKTCLAHIGTQLPGVGDVLRDLQQHLRRAAERFQNRFAEEEKLASIGVAGQYGLIPSLVTKKVTANLSELVLDLDERMQSAFLAEFGGLRQLATRNHHEWTHTLERDLNQQARLAVSSQVRQLDLNRLFADNKISPDKISAWARGTMNAAVPHLLHNCGGSSRLLVAFPEGTDPEPIRQVVEGVSQDRPSYMAVTNGDVIMCYEVGQIPATQIAAALLHNCPEALDLINRIHTRTDVEWTPIIRLD